MDHLLLLGIVAAGCLLMSRRREKQLRRGRAFLAMRARGQAKRGPELMLFSSRLGMGFGGFRRSVPVVTPKKLDRLESSRKRWLWAAVIVPAVLLAIDTFEQLVFHV